VIVAEVERLHWRIWNGKAKNAQRSIKRIRKVMHVFKGEHSQGAKGVASRKLWHALRSDAQTGTIPFGVADQPCGLASEVFIDRMPTQTLPLLKRLDPPNVWTVPLLTAKIACIPLLDALSLMGTKRTVFLPAGCNQRAHKTDDCDPSCN
jgi:hypothetical protein